MRVNYISFEHLCKTIKNNLSIIPHNIDLIVGVPRSGMLAATIISELLHIKLTDINNFYENKIYNGGDRTINTKNKIENVLIIDDTCNSGKALTTIKNKVNDLKLDKTYNILYACIFLEGKNANEFVDIYFEDVRNNVSDVYLPIIYYEWNLFNHGDYIMDKFMFDIDGVLCCEPCDERNTNNYINDITNAKALYTSNNTLGYLVTYRLKKYKDLTINWLEKNNIKYNKLYMFNAETYEERSNVNPAVYKAQIYNSHNDTFLFIESSDIQAKHICYLTHKPTYSVEENCVYNFIENNKLEICK